MKNFKLLLLVCIGLICLSSCTENARTKKFGGTKEIKLNAGEKLMMVTWKDNNLFYLTEPMENDYYPKTKILREDSSWGILESKVIFIESR